MSVTTVKNRPILVGITGGIASGKSVFTNYIEQKGYLVLDSDKIVFSLWESDKPLHKFLKSEFGLSVEDLNYKTKLSKIIFSDEVKRKKLNNFIHPKVFETIDNVVNDNLDKKIIFIDMPLLYEVEYESRVDYVFVVYTSLKRRIKRLIKRDGISKSDAITRINSQMDLKIKKKKANYVINNNYSLRYTYKQIDKKIKEVLTKWTVCKLLK